MEPTYSDGKKTPPDPPDASVRLVATILNGSSSASHCQDSFPLKAASMVAYPTPYRLGTDTIRRPSSIPPAAGRHITGSRTREARDSNRAIVHTIAIPTTP